MQIPQTKGVFWSGLRGFN